MAAHDAYARITPYELSFPDLDTARGSFAAIRGEAEARGTDVRDPAALVMLAAAGEALRAIRGPEDDPALIREYGAMLYHAYHFAAAGEAVWLLGTGALRTLLAADPIPPGWVPTLEPSAGYVQLPQHLVWVRPDAEAQPESLDGFHWTRSGEDTLELLLALGVRGDRAGLSVVPLEGLPLREASSWSALAMREEGEDFSSTLPGSALEGLCEIRSAGEALKLAARVLARIEAEGMPGEPSPSEALPAAPGAPRRSALRYRRLA